MGPVKDGSIMEDNSTWKEAFLQSKSKKACLLMYFLLSRFYNLQSIKVHSFLDDRIDERGKENQ